MEKRSAGSADYGAIFFLSIAGFLALLYWRGELTVCLGLLVIAIWLFISVVTAWTKT